MLTHHHKSDFQPLNAWRLVQKCHTQARKAGKKHGREQNPLFTDTHD